MTMENNSAGIAEKIRAVECFTADVADPCAAFDFIAVEYTNSQGASLIDFSYAPIRLGTKQFALDARNAAVIFYWNPCPDSKPMEYDFSPARAGLASASFKQALALATYCRWIPLFTRYTMVDVTAREPAGGALTQEERYEHILSRIPELLDAGVPVYLTQSPRLSVSARMLSRFPHLSLPMGYHRYKPTQEKLKSGQAFALYEGDRFVEEHSSHLLAEYLVGFFAPMMADAVFGNETGWRVENETWKMLDALTFGALAEMMPESHGDGMPLRSTCHVELEELFADGGPLAYGRQLRDAVYDIALIWKACFDAACVRALPCPGKRSDEIARNLLSAAACTGVEASVKAYLSGVPFDDIIGNTTVPQR